MIILIASLVTLTIFILILLYRINYAFKGSSHIQIKVEEVIVRIPKILYTIRGSYTINGDTCTYADATVITKFEEIKVGDELQLINTKKHFRFLGRIK